MAQSISFSCRPSSRDPPAVGDAAAVPAHPQTLLQVRCEARGRDQPLAVWTLALFVFPLVVHLAKYVHAGLIHDFWGKIGRNEAEVEQKETKERSLLTKLFHALLVCFVQVEVALFHGPVDLEAQAQTGVLHQLRVDVMDQGLEGQVRQVRCGEIR